MTYKLDVTCVVVSGYESDSLYADGKHRSLSSLFAEAGGEAVEESLQYAIIRALNTNGRNEEALKSLREEGNGLLLASELRHQARFAEEVAAYRSEHDGKLPPVYRMKLKIDLEEVPADEAEAFWRRM